MLNSPVEEIKNRLDIVEVIGSYIKLQKAGANFRALCPFHSEKQPSFFVSPARQIWHCFGGCGVGGDIFKFVMMIEGVEFGDALRILAQRAGVQLKKQDPKLNTERQRLYEVCELACCFFEKQLQGSSTGKEAEKYLLARGLTDQSLKKWRIGYSPDVWQGLSDFLFSRGYKQEEIQKAGLALTSERGSFYDRFRGRIIFPIFDLNSRVIGFGGRIFKSEDTAKYLNTPSTLLYDKSRVLYGLDKAKIEIRKKNHCILVEGYLDLILVSQAGCQNVVATSGTALTSYQLQLLKRYSDNLSMAFDMDVAGDSATKRGIDLAQNQGFNIKTVIMPEGKDPADIVSKNPLDWQKLAEKAKSIIEFYFQTAFARLSAKAPEGKREISKIILPVIKRIPNKIERSHWVQELAKRLGVKEEVVEEEMKSIRDDSFHYSPEEAPIKKALPLKTRKELLEERIASLILKTPANSSLIPKDHFSYFSQRVRVVLTGSPPPEDADFVNYLSLRGEIEEESFDCQQEIKTCLAEIKNLEIKSKLNEICQDIKRAEEEKNQKKINSLTQEFNKLSQELIEKC